MVSCHTSSDTVSDAVYENVTILPVTLLVTPFMKMVSCHTSSDTFLAPAVAWIYTVSLSERKTKKTLCQCKQPHCIAEWRKWTKWRCTA
eukprot:1158151-Pelagomonas_calceolata.AAC.1